jgi:hypothetical protein
MLTATSHGFHRRRALGAVKLPTLTVATGPTLAPPVYGGDAPPSWYPGIPGSDPLPPPPPPGGGGSTTPSKPVQYLWFNAAVGPTAGDGGSGGTQPPAPQSPADVAVDTVSGGGGGGGGGGTPVATDPTATVVVGTEPPPARRWWPWAVGAAVLAVAGAYVLKTY